MLYVFSSPLSIVDSILTWRWPSTAETCCHRRTNKLRYLNSCVLTDLSTLIISICPYSGVLGCIRIILLHMVFSTGCCGWGSEEPVCSLVHWCKFCILAWGSVVVKALRHQSDGPGIDSRWYHWIFQWHIPSDRTMALGSTQSLVKMSTRNISWG